MKTRELMMLGLKEGPAIKAAHPCVGIALAGGIKQNEVKATVKAVIADPAAYASDQNFGEFANALAASAQAAVPYQSASKMHP